MQVKYIGASLRQGISAKSGKAYVIAECLYSTPDKSGSKHDENGKLIWDYTAHGDRVQQLSIKPSAIDAFKDCVPGEMVDLLLECQPENPSRNWVVGVK